MIHPVGPRVSYGLAGTHNTLHWTQMMQYLLIIYITVQGRKTLHIIQGHMEVKFENRVSNQGYRMHALWYQDGGITLIHSVNHSPGCHSYLGIRFPAPNLLDKVYLVRRPYLQEQTGEENLQ